MALHHICLQDNPADIASTHRILLGNKLANCEFWWNGTKFLYTNDDNFMSNGSFNDEETKRIKICIHFIFAKFSFARKWFALLLLFTIHSQILTTAGKQNPQTFKYEKIKRGTPAIVRNIR